MSASSYFPLHSGRSASGKSRFADRASRVVFAERLSQYGLVYLHIIESRVSGVQTIREGQEAIASAFLLQVFTGPIIAAGGFDREGGEAILRRGDADAAAFGRHSTSNPDLPERFQQELPLTSYVCDAFGWW